MIASKTAKATRLPGTVFLCAALLGSGNAVAAEQNGLSINGLSINGLRFNEAADNPADAVAQHSRETEAARVWDAVRRLSKAPLTQKK